RAGSGVNVPSLTRRSGVSGQCTVHPRNEPTPPDEPTRAPETTTTRRRAAFGRERTGGQNRARKVRGGPHSEAGPSGGNAPKPTSFLPGARGRMNALKAVSYARVFN